MCRRIGIADRAAEEREHVERLDAKRVVVDFLGKLERRARVGKRFDEPLDEPRRPRELTVNARLQRRP